MEDGREEGETAVRGRDGDEGKRVVGAKERKQLFFSPPTSSCWTN